MEDKDKRIAELQRQLAEARELLNEAEYEHWGFDPYADEKWQKRRDVWIEALAGGEVSE